MRKSLAKPQPHRSFEHRGTDYQLIVPKEKLQKVLADEIKAFSEEKENKETL